MADAESTTSHTERKQSTPFSVERAWAGAPPVDASEEDKAYYTIARYSVQNDHYAGLYQLWIKPIFFLVGKQWLTWNAKARNYSSDTDVPEWRQQPVTNWTYAVYRSLVAKLTKQRPTLEVVPPSGDSEDRDAAKLGEAIVEFLWRHLKSPQKVIRAIGWILATGNVAFNVGWDDKAGESRPRTVLVEVPDPANPGQTLDVECACDEQGEPYRKEVAAEGEPLAIDGGLPYDVDREPEMEAIGEQVLDVDDPLSYRFNPEATSAEDADEFFVARLWPLKKVCRDFDVSEGEVTTGGGEAESERAALDDVLSAVAAGAPDPFNNKAEQLGSSQDEGIGERVLVIEYYAKPCAEEGYPEGRHWITAGGAKVWPKPDDAAYPNGEAPLPFSFWPPRVCVVDTPIPGQPQGMGILSQVVPLNEKYNFHDGKIGEYHTTMAMGGVIWVHPSDKGIQITSEPGQVKSSHGLAVGRPPIREQLTALPGPVYAERELIGNMIRTVAGLSQVDMGQKPEGVSAGRAFLVLQEASSEAIMPTLMALEGALEEIGRRQLIVGQQKYTEPRTIKIRGEKGKWEFRSFTNADLRDGMDVRVQVGSSFPWSKSAQWDTRLNLLTALKELVLKPDGSIDEEKLAKYLDAGGSGLSAFETDEDADLVEIDREHAMFEEYDPTDPTKSNELPQLAFWQNQPKHQVGHFEFLKRSAARFKRWSPAAQMAFMEHCRLTTEAVQALVNSVMPAGQADPNAPPGGEEQPAATGPQLVQPKPAPTAGSTQRLTRGDRAAAGV